MDGHLDGGCPAALVLEVQELKGAIQHLTIVLQGEQDRLTELEHHAKDQMTRLDGLTEEHHLHRSRTETTQKNLHLAHKDLALNGLKLSETLEHVSVHDRDLAQATHVVKTLSDGQEDIVRRLDLLERREELLTASTDELMAFKKEQLVNRVDVHKNLELLTEQSKEAFQQLQRLREDAQATSKSLESLDVNIVQPALLEAASERQHLSSLESEFKQLLDHHGKHYDDHHILRRDFDSQVASLSALDRHLKESVGGRLTESDSQHERTFATCKAHAESLEDLFRQVAKLDEAEREANTALLRSRQQWTELDASHAEQGERVHHLAEALAALQQGLADTDGELEELRAYLEVPR